MKAPVLAHVHPRDVAEAMRFPPRWTLPSDKRLALALLGDAVALEQASFAPVTALRALRGWINALVSGPPCPPLGLAVVPAWDSVLARAPARVPEPVPEMEPVAGLPLVLRPLVPG